MPALTPSLYIQLPTWSLVLTAVGLWYCATLGCRLGAALASWTSAAYHAHQRRRTWDRTRATRPPLPVLRATNPWSGAPAPDRTTTLGDLRGLDLSARPLSPETLARLALRPPLPPEAEQAIYADLRSLPCTRDPQRH